MSNQIKITYKETNFFSKLINDYIEENDSLSDKISFSQILDNFYKQIKNKSKQNLDRKLLVDVLKQQNSKILLSKFSKKYRTIIKKQYLYSYYRASIMFIYWSSFFYL